MQEEEILEGKSFDTDAQELYRTLFTADITKQNIAIIMDERQVLKLITCLDYLLRPQVTYRLDNELVTQQILYRSLMVSSFVLDEIRAALPEKHRLRCQADLVWDDLEGNIQESAKVFRERSEHIRKHGWPG